MTSADAMCINTSAMGLLLINILICKFLDQKASLQK